MKNQIKFLFPVRIFSGLAILVSLMVSLPQAQALPTDLTAVPIYDTSKAGLSFKKDRLSVVGMWEVPGKPKHFMVAGYFGYLWTLYPDTTQADTMAAWGPIKRYTRTTVADFNTWVMKGWEFGTLGGAFDPKFSENRFFYVIYNKYPQASQYCAGTNATNCGGVNVNGPSNAQAIVVVDRYKLSPDFKSAVRDTEIIRLFHGSGYGSSNMIFGNDGMLYITTDAYGSASWDSTITARKILRIDVSANDGNSRDCVAGATPSATTLPCGIYAVPTDNPWYNAANPAVRKEVFAFGFRNTYSLSFNYLTNRLYGAETGQTRWEEVNHIMPGRNYGWNAGGDGSGDGNGVEGPCHIGNVLDSSSAGGAFSTSGGFRTPWNRVITGTTYARTYTCADFTNAAWYTGHTAPDSNTAGATAAQLAGRDGLNNSARNAGMRANVPNISPVFRGDPTSPLYGYMLISDIHGNSTVNGTARNMNFWAVKEHRVAPIWVGSFPQNYNFSQVNADHDGIHTWSEDSYGNLYPMTIHSTATGPTDWHDIWVLRSPGGGLTPLTTPRAQVTPTPTPIWNASQPARKGIRLMANVIAGSQLEIPKGYSGVEIYNLTGRMVWNYRGNESAVQVPSNLEMGVLQAKFTR